MKTDDGSEWFGDPLPATHSAPPIRDDGTGLEIRLVTLVDSAPGSGERTVRPARAPADLQPADDEDQTVTVTIENVSETRPDTRVRLDAVTLTE